MRVRCLIIVIMVLMMSQMGSSREEAFVFIHEFLADPASGLAGDANGDDRFGDTRFRGHVPNYRVI